MSEPTIASVLDKSIDKLSGGAAEIAKAAKQIAPHAWEVAVRQQIIEGATQLLVWLALTGTAAFCFRMGLRNLAADRHEAAIGVPIAIGTLLGLVSLLAALFGGATVVGMLLNPEYYAAWNLLQAIK